MKIESAKYLRSKLVDENVSTSTDNIGIIATINGKSWTVPLDPDNTDYAEIMRQVEAGELTIAPADEEE